MVQVLDGGLSMKLTDQLRDLIRTCGKTRYRISQESGVPQSTLSRFMSGTEMSTAALDRLAPVLGLKITTTAAKTPRPPQTPRNTRKTTQPKTRRIKVKQKGDA